MGSVERTPSGLGLVERVSEAAETMATASP